MQILWLGQPECHDIEVVGGKVANLSRLAVIHRVPPGFCLTAATFQNGVTTGPWTERPLASGLSISSALYDLLADAYRGLAKLCQMPEISVAVRSSALDEDGSAVSFAGQHDTYLNVVGEESIADAVVRCCASVNNPHALEYRRQRSIPVDNVRIAVLVQQMVQADISAVVFGANPVTGKRDEVVINASWGLGESVVGGTVTPDSYVVRKHDLTVVTRQIGRKLRMTVQVPGGTSEVNVPRLLQTQPVVNDEQVVEMARLAIELEKTMGWPVDIECAYSAGQLYLLQCRPVTTLS
jgi:pyruvate,water dikinase